MGAMLVSEQIGRALRILQTARLFHVTNTEDQESMLKLERTVEIMEARLSASVGRTSNNINCASGRLTSNSATSPQLAALHQAQEIAMVLQKASSGFSTSLQASQVIGKGPNLACRAYVDPDEVMELLRSLGDIGSRIAAMPSRLSLVNDESTITESALRQVHLWLCHVRSSQPCRLLLFQCFPYRTTSTDTRYLKVCSCDHFTIVTSRYQA